MEDRRTWRLRYWIIGGYAIPMIALTVSAVVTVLNVGIVSDRSQKLHTSGEIEAIINKLAVDVQITSRATRGYLLDKDTTSIDSFQQARERAKQLLPQLKALVRDQQQLQNLNRFEQQFGELNTINQGLFKLVDAGQTKQAIATWKNDNGRDRIEELTKLIDELQLREGQIVAINTQQQQEALASLQLTLLLATIASLLLSSLVGAWVIGRTSRQMHTSSAAIAASTSEIATTVEQQERTATQQAASISETTTTMDELGASSRQSSEQAEASAAGARQALALAGNGTKAVEQTMYGMETLRQKVGAIANQILRLSEQTSQIGSISGLVSDLANQTNMLALNAAVEAVRAGEHGKGFAVVAAEIRKLADQSKNSAEKINALVNDIQTAINSTVMVTDEGTKTVEEGVKIAQATSDSFVGVADAVNNVVLNSQQISLNIKQQAIAIQQVVTAMNALNIAAQETATGMSQIKIGTQRLNDAAQELQAVV